MKPPGTAIRVALVSLLLVCLVGDAVRAGTAFHLETPSRALVGISVEFPVPIRGVLIVNRRDVEKQSFRAGIVGDYFKWVSRYGSVTFAEAGIEFAQNGMNEAGLVVDTLYLRASEAPEPDSRAPLDSGSWVQYVLDTCGSVEAAVAVDSRVRIDEEQEVRSHFFLADASGDCAVFEYLDGRLVVYRGEDLPFRVLTNMRYERAVKAHERGGARWWWANPDDSAQRFSHVVDRLETFAAGVTAGPDDDAGHAGAVDYGFETLDDPFIDPVAQWSVVHDLRARRVWFRTAASPAPRYVSLEHLDFSCDAPTLTLDVNAELRGDVTSSLAPYDHDTNLGLFLEFVRRFRIDVSGEEARGLIRHFESFECAR